MRQAAGIAIDSVRRRLHPREARFRSISTAAGLCDTPSGRDRRFQAHALVRVLADGRGEGYSGTAAPLWPGRMPHLRGPLRGGARRDRSMLVPGASAHAGLGCRMTWVAQGLGLALLLVLGGVVVRTASDFVGLVDRPAPDPASLRADGIVVFSGSSRRVSTGLRLLRAGRTPRLLVAGGDDVEAFRPTNGDLLACCVDLRPASRNTAEDAATIAHWAREHGMTSVLAVTTDVHVPRALIELAFAAPDLRVTAYPVSSRDGEDGVDRYTAMPREYLKWIVTRLWLQGRGWPRRSAGDAPIARPPPATSAD